MYRVNLTLEEQWELRRRTREAGIMPRTRDRLEMVRLSHEGWSIPKIAVYLGTHEHRVRYWIKRYLAGGFDALPDQPHPGQKSAVTPAILASMKAEIAKADRTWTARQLADWMEAEHGLRRSPEQLSRLLKRDRIVFKRTGRGIKHKQKPEEVAAKKAELEALEKKGDEGLIDVCHLDEAGFAMTQPTTYSWYFMKERLTIPYEAPQGRRLNVMGAYFSHGPCAGRFEFESLGSLPKSQAKVPRMTLAELAEKHGLELHEVGTLDANFFVKFVWKIAGRPEGITEGWKRERPLWIPTDNYSVHKGEVVRSVREALEAADIHLFYLPSYSPELSEIEPIWKAVKYREMTTRSYTSLGDLKEGVDEALTRKAEKLLAAHAGQEVQGPWVNRTDDLTPFLSEGRIIEATKNPIYEPIEDELAAQNLSIIPSFPEQLLCKAA